MQRCDVLIVGAGLAGLWTAGLLGGAGLSVVLVDDRAAVDERIRTTGIFVRRTLQEFPLPEDCLGPEIGRVILHSPKYRSQLLQRARAEFRVARMGKLYRRLLAGAIEAGVTFRPRTRCLGLGCEGGRTRVRLGGRHSQMIEARFVIGADGARSRTAEWLGLSRNREWIVGVEEVYQGIPLDGPPALHCVLSPALAPGYLAWVVQDGEEVHLGVGGYPDRFDASAALAAFRANPPVGLDWSKARLVDRRGGLIPVGGILPRIAGPAGLLVGDAAGAVSPLTAGGLDPCLRLSELAAKVTMEFLSSGDPAALAPYDGAAFRRRFRTRLLLRSALARLRSPILAEAACGVLRLSPFHRLAEQVFFGRGSFPDVDRFPPEAVAPVSTPRFPASRSSA